MKTLGLSPELYDYLLACNPPEHPTLRDLRRQTAALPHAIMQIPAEQGSLLATLVEMNNVKRYLEIGVFTGYSSLAVALAMPNDGRIVACDVNRDYTQYAEKAWEAAGVRYKVDLRIAPALQTLDALIAKGEENTFDMAFIDADKVNQGNYYERCLKLVRPRGIVLVDNALFHGSVIDPARTDEHTEGVRALNAKICRDERVRMSMLSVADGLVIAVKK
jgi:predicted O-methyltransferase YrrM